MICPYCNEERKPTREHIIPNCFLKAMNREEQITWSEAAPIRVINTDLIIKDVCKECNEGLLSKYDNYALSLMMKYHGQLNHNTTKIILKYNYKLLSKWLLKVCYNSTRANKREYDASVFSKQVPFIMDTSENGEFDVFGCFVDISMNGNSYDQYHFDKDSPYFIDSFRITQIAFQELLTFKCAIRAIMINSFVFLVIAYENDDLAYRQEVKNVVFKLDYNFQLLTINGRTKLVKDKLFWENSIFSSSMLIDNFLERRNLDDNSPKFYELEITKENLRNMDFQIINEYLAFVTQNKDMFVKSYQSLIIHVSGYDDDERELFEIEEFRSYAKTINEKFLELTWFMNLEFGYGFFLQLYFVYTIDKFDKIKKEIIFKDKKNSQQFLITAFNRINNLANKYAVDNSMIDDVTRKVIKVIEDFHKNSEVT